MCEIEKDAKPIKYVTTEEGQIVCWWAAHETFSMPGERTVEASDFSKLLREQKERLM